MDMTLDDLFHETLKDVYYAERKLLSALKKQARGAADPALKEAFLAHREETETHVERLQQVFEMIGKRPRGKTCDAIEGIVSEAEEVMEEFKGAPALDAGLLAAAQAAEHYEISRYGSLIAWAKSLGLNDAAALMEQTLAEEKAADQKLSKLAETAVNTAAKAKAA